MLGSTHRAAGDHESWEGTFESQGNRLSRSRPPGAGSYLTVATMEFEDESTWLRHRVLRLRTILRYAKDPRAENGLRELIAEAEKRLEQLETIRQAKHSQKS